MAGPCYYHPEIAAAGTCIQCGMGACTDCLQQIGGRSVCAGCSSAFKARLAQQAPVYGASPPPYSAGYSAPPSIYSAPPEVSYSGTAVGMNPSDKKELWIGILLALVIGIIGAVIIEKILFYAHFGLSLLYIGMGYGIGWGIHRATGRGGPGLALLAVGIMLTCLGVSHLVFAQDMLNAARADGGVDPRVTVFDVFPIAVGGLGFMHWVCILFGVMACYRGVEAQQG